MASGSLACPSPILGRQAVPFELFLDRIDRIGRHHSHHLDRAGRAFLDAGFAMLAQGRIDRDAAMADLDRRLGAQSGMVVSTVIFESVADRQSTLALI